MDCQHFLFPVRHCVITGTSQKSALHPWVEESLGRGGIVCSNSANIRWFSILVSAGTGLCAGLSCSFEFAWAVKWLSGALPTPGLAPGTLNPILPIISDGFLPICYLSHGGPACRKQLCGERATVLGVHSGGAHGASEFRIQ